MDFFIKASYAAAQLQDKALSNPSTATEVFFDDPRILVMLLSLILAVVSLGWQIKNIFKIEKNTKKAIGINLLFFHFLLINLF